MKLPHAPSPLSLAGLRRGTLYSRVYIGTQVTISDKRIAVLLPEEEPTLLARQD